MDTIVMKFGGSSVADNDKLKLVAKKIIDLYNKENNIVVVLSAQGKTTDKLIKEANELSCDIENIVKNYQYGTDKLCRYGLVRNCKYIGILGEVYADL